jgi:hypothetical protein
VKEIAQTWGQLSKTEKQAYKDASKRGRHFFLISFFTDKERYVKEMKRLEH